MAKSNPTTKSKKTPEAKLTLVVEGTTNLRVPVSITTFAMSKAGKSGVEFNNVCATHKERLKSPKVCQSHLDEARGAAQRALALIERHLNDPQVPLEEGESTASLIQQVRAGVVADGDVGEKVLKGYKDTAYLKPEVVDALKPRRSDTIRLLHFHDKEELGLGTPSDFVASITPKTSALDPVGDASALARGAALRDMLGTDKVGLVQVTTSSRVWYGWLNVTKEGNLVVSETYAPEDVKNIPRAKLPALASEQLAKLRAKAAELTRSLDPELLNDNPYRREMERAIERAVDGEEVTIEQEEEVEEKPTEDLLSLL
jgi:hypothetical protein